MPRPSLAILLCLLVCAAQAADTVESAARKLDGLARQARPFTRPDLEKLFGARLKPGSCSPSNDYHDGRDLTGCFASAVLSPGRGVRTLIFDWTGMPGEPVVFEHVRLEVGPPGCKSAKALAAMLGRKLAIRRLPPMREFFGGTQYSVPPASVAVQSSVPPPPIVVMRQIRYAGSGASNREPSIVMSFSEEAGCTRGIELSWTSAAHVEKKRAFWNSIVPPRN